MSVEKQSQRREGLCSTCENLATTSKFVLGGSRNFATFGEVVRTSDAGCTLCTAIRNALLIFTPYNISSDGKIWIWREDQILRLGIYDSRYFEYIKPLQFDERASGIEIFATPGEASHLEMLSVCTEDLLTTNIQTLLRALDQ